MKIRHRLCTAGLGFLSLLLSSLAVAQSPPETLLGYWLGNGIACGSTVLHVTSVEPGGAVRGSLDCTQLGFVMALGDKAEPGKTLKAQLSGKKLDLEGGNSTGFELTLEADQLTGFGLAGPGVRNPIIFTKKKEKK